MTTRDDTPPRSHSFATLAVHAGGEEGEADVAPPIHLATTFRRDEALEPVSGHTYGRESNPSLDRLERALTSLEGGSETVVFSSGIAAATTLFQAIAPGGRVLLPGDVYHGVRAALEELGSRWGHQLADVDPLDPEDLERALADHPRPSLVWIETPSNPLLQITDISVAARQGRDAGALVVVDNTFATPALQQPISLGADVVLHSTTKYCSGHSDNLGGALVFAPGSVALAQQVRHLRHRLGGVPSPFGAWLTLRGLRTLACRVETHSRNALAVARFLAAQSAVSRVHYPGLEDHAGHQVAARQMRSGFGGMLSFQVHGGREAARDVVSRARLCTRATSLGGVETLIEHRATSEGPEGRAPHDLVRMSIGLEHADDLIADLATALAG